MSKIEEDCSCCGSEVCPACGGTSFKKEFVDEESQEVFCAKCGCVL